MGQMNSIYVSKEILVAHQCQAMTHFELLALWLLTSSSNLSENYQIVFSFSHHITSVTGKQFNITHMHPMICVMAFQENFMAYHCQAMTNLVLAPLPKMCSVPKTYSR
jgi:hypothetical protein